MSDMPAIAAHPVSELEPTVRLFSVAEFHQMYDAGVFGADERVELLDGRPIAMPPMSPAHAWSVRSIDDALRRHVGPRAVVSTQLPVVLDEWSEPLPDLALLTPPNERYVRAHPAPSDILLLVEVALPSLPYDAGTKLRAYARTGIAEYWIIDLSAGRIEVYRHPKVRAYRTHLRAERGGTVTISALPDVTIAVDELLPPRAT